MGLLDSLLRSLRRQPDVAAAALGEQLREVVAGERGRAGPAGGATGPLGELNRWALDLVGTERLPYHLRPVVRSWKERVATADEIAAAMRLLGDDAWLTHAVAEAGGPEGAANGLIHLQGAFKMEGLLKGTLLYDRTLHREWRLEQDGDDTIIIEERQGP